MFTKILLQTFQNSTAKIFRLSTLKLNSLLISVPNVDIVRHAARRGTRAAKLAEKKAKKLAEQNKPQAIPKYLQRKVRVSADLERRRCLDENWLETQPIDNVYNMKLYRGRPYLFSDAIQMHRDSHVPALINDPSTLVYANVELDLRLKKKDRYVDTLTGILTFPHEFKSEKQNRIIAICKETDLQLKASDAGAVMAGATTLIKQILAGTVYKEDFDYVVCHPDMLKELNVLRGILAKKFPNTNNGLLRLDIEDAVKSLLNSVEYNLKRSSLEPDFGWVDVPFGRLDMPIEQLEVNFKTVLESVEKLKPMGTGDVLFIIRTLICSPKSREKFKVPHWSYLSNYPENGILKEDIEEELDSKESTA